MKRIQRLTLVLTFLLLSTNFAQASVLGLLFNTPSAAPSYKVYTALLTQTGTDAPVATVLENTLGGDIVFTRLVDGVYYGTLTGAFTASKTVIISSVGFIPNQTTWRVECSRASADQLLLYTTKGGTPSDGTISGYFIEIRVYP